MNLLKKENVRIIEKANDWKDAVFKSVQPLEDGGFVTPEYKEAIVANVEELGPYICIAPDVAMPHARPEQGAVKTQIAVTLFRNEVLFEREDAKARLFIALAAADNNTHMDALVTITDILQDEDHIEKIVKSSDSEELFQYFK